MAEIEQLIQQVEAKLSSSDTDILECLKKARIIAKHYNDLTILKWINDELVGYKSEEGFPDYRRIHVSLYRTKVEVNRLMGYRRTSKEIIESTPYAITDNLREIVKNSEKEVLDYTFYSNGNQVPMMIRGSDLKSIVMQVVLKLMDYIQDKSVNISKIPHETTIMKLLNKFHLVATQLEQRYNNRGSLIVNDEYDTQDLLRSLLNLFFDSVQKEEYGSQYAGKRSRIDFYLRFEKIGIEAKKIRDKKHAKDVIEEIIIDKEYYSNHTDVNELYFFVYDPEFLITERIDFVKDLEKNKPNQFKILKVIIKPEF